MSKNLNSKNDEKKSWSYADGVIIGTVRRLVFRRRSASFGEEALGLATVAEQLGIKNGVTKGDQMLAEPWLKRKRKRSKHGGRVVWRIFMSLLACGFVVLCAIATGLTALAPNLNIDAVPRQRQELDSPDRGFQLEFSSNIVTGAGLFNLLIDNPSFLDLQLKFDSFADKKSPATKVSVYLMIPETKEFEALNDAKVIDKGAIRVPINVYDFEIPMTVEGAGQKTDVKCVDSVVLAKVVVDVISVHSIAGEKLWTHLKSRVFPLPCGDNSRP